MYDFEVRLLCEFPSLTWAPGIPPFPETSVKVPRGSRLNLFIALIGLPKHENFNPPQIQRDDLRETSLIFF